MSEPEFHPGMQIWVLEGNFERTDGVVERVVDDQSVVPFNVFGRYVALELPKRNLADTKFDLGIPVTLAKQRNNSNFM